MAPTRAANWEEEILTHGISKRTRRSGGAYTGPGSGGDVPQQTDTRPPPIAFSGGIPDPLSLPIAALQAAAERVFEKEDHAALQYGGDQGLLGLRQWLADHWSKIDGLTLTPENFCLTNGSAGALANVSETFLDEGDLVLFESPSFPGSIRVIRSLGATVESVTLDHDGLNVDALAEKLEEIERRGQRARLLYTIPNYHNPTGTCLTLERRHRLVELCERHDVLVVEDDAYGELGFEEETPPSLYAISGGRGVIKAGSFSKIIATGLRVGWCQATPPIVQALLATRFDMGQTPLVQRTIHEYASGGELERHIVDIRRIYQRKCDVMLNELRERCAGLATWKDPLGGFFAWLELDDRVDPLALQAAAEEERVVFVGGRRFFAEQFFADAPSRGLTGSSDSPFIRLAFSYTAEEQIPEGVRRLARAMERAALS